MEESEIIVSGPEFSGAEYWGSVAEYLVPRMRSHPKDFVIQVDCATGESITCRDFLQRTFEVAEGLIEMGLKEEDVVAFLCPDNIRSHVAAFGTIFSGGTLAPIDEHMKAVELQNILKQFQPKYVICESGKGKEIRAILKGINLEPKIILIDSLEPTGEFFSWEEMRTVVDFENYTPRPVAHPKKSKALISCSSGTTGTPKGVAVSHYTILYNLALTESIHIPAGKENFILSSPLHWISGFILSVNSCYFQQTRYIPRSTDPEDLLDAVQKCKPFFLLLAPNILLSMVQHPDFKKYDVSSVKVVFSAGGTLTKEVLGKITKTWNGLAVSNLYGLTETFGAITWPQDSDDRPAIGKLLPGFSVKVVDPSTGKSLGPNQVGECRIKSKRVMDYYYNNEKDTKAAFDENGWFRTGDLVYFNEDEEFYFSGRIKEVIQYLNHQIAPSELESFLICMPGVKDVAVVPIPHETDDNHIRALVVKHSNSKITAEEIILAVKENFGYQKQLTAGVQFVEALPRTTTGKIRRLEAQKLVQMSKT